MTALANVPAQRRINALADAAERWNDADFPPRVRAVRALEERLGYSEPVIDYALDRLFGALSARELRAAIERELGSVAALDGTDGGAYARGAGRVVVISSDTTIGVAVMPLVFALCAGCSVTVKDRSDALVAAFLQTVIEELPEAGATAQALSWNGGDDPAEAELLAAADVVVAFGRDRTLATIRAHCAPQATFVPFGHRVSVGYLAAADALGAELADGIARDALLYDGEGCLSLHALYAERAIDDGSLAAALGAAFERATLEFPAGMLPPSRAAQAAGYRNAAAFRAAGGHGRVYRTADGSGTLVLDASAAEPPPLVARTLPVIRVDGPAEAAAAVAGARLPIQALGVADPLAPAVLRLATTIGAARIARFGNLQNPPASGHHGGRPRIADFVRWIDRA